MRGGFQNTYHPEGERRLNDDFRGGLAAVAAAAADVSFVAENGRDGAESESGEGYPATG